MSVKIRTVRTGELMRFALVGGIGFAVDGGLLTLFHGAFEWGPVEARLVSFPVAVFVTWLLNRTFTFRLSPADRGVRLGEYSRYFSVQLAGAGVNLAFYILLLAAIPPLRAIPLIPLGLAAGIAMLVNYICSRHFVFAPASRHGN